MHSRTALSVSFLLLALAGLGCTSSHDAMPTDYQAILRHPGVVPTPNLDSCFTGSGALVELGAVSNNDQHDHGALLTFGISPSGLLAAAGADGTLKFWTMDATLVGTANPTVLTYGPEIAAAPITDLAFTDTLAIAGDVRGLVEQLGPTGEQAVLGGTTPGVSIASVAFDRVAHRLAHAQHRGTSGTAVTPLVVNTLDGTMHANITDTMLSITDLAFTVEGVLVVGGNDGTRAMLELRDGADPTRVIATPTLSGSTVVEVATAHLGPTIVALTDHALFVIEGTRARQIVASEVAFRSVDVTPSGDFALTVDASGSVVVWSTSSGAAVAHRSIGSALGVRIDSGGRRAVVGGSDAMLHVLGCR